MKVLRPAAAVILALSISLAALAVRVPASPPLETTVRLVAMTGSLLARPDAVCPHDLAAAVLALGTRGAAAPATDPVQPAPLLASAAHVADS